MPAHCIETLQLFCMPHAVNLIALCFYIALTFSPNIVTPEPEPQRISRGAVDLVPPLPPPPPPPAPRGMEQEAEERGVSRKEHAPFIWCRELISGSDLEN